MQINLIRNYEVRKVLVTLFETLLWLNRDEMVVYNEKDLCFTNVKKKEKDIISVEIDYFNLEKKIYEWMFSNENLLNLNENESECFLECLHAAEFYLLRLDGETPAKKTIIQFNKRIFSFLERCGDGRLILIE